MKRAVAVALLSLTAPIALAQMGGMKGMDMKGDMDMKGMDMNREQEAPAAAVHKASGRVTKVDRAKGSLTIAHGPVASMNWPSMTMSFKVKDKTMADKVESGDQVEFSFMQSGRDYIVTDIE